MKKNFKNYSSFRRRKKRNSNINRILICKTDQMFKYKIKTKYLFISESKNNIYNKKNVNVKI